MVFCVAKFSTICGHTLDDIIIFIRWLFLLLIFWSHIAYYHDNFSIQARRYTVKRRGRVTTKSGAGHKASRNSNRQSKALKPTPAGQPSLRNERITGLFYLKLDLIYLMCRGREVTYWHVEWLISQLILRIIVAMRIVSGSKINQSIG